MNLHPVQSIVSFDDPKKDEAIYSCEKELSIRHLRMISVTDYFFEFGLGPEKRQAPFV